MKQSEQSQVRKFSTESEAWGWLQQIDTQIREDGNPRCRVEASLNNETGEATYTAIIEWKAITVE